MPSLRGLHRIDFHVSYHYSWQRPTVPKIEKEKTFRYLIGFRRLPKRDEVLRVHRFASYVAQFIDPIQRSHRHLFTILQFGFPSYFPAIFEYSGGRSAAANRGAISRRVGQKKKEKKRICNTTASCWCATVWFVASFRTWRTAFCLVRSPFLRPFESTRVLHLAGHLPSRFYSLPWCCFDYSGGYLWFLGPLSRGKCEMNSRNCPAIFVSRVIRKTWPLSLIRNRLTFLDSILVFRSYPLLFIAFSEVIRLTFHNILPSFLFRG